MSRFSRSVLNVEQAISIKFNNITYEMKKDGIDVIVLSLGEAFFEIPLFSFKDLPFPNIYHYSHSRGIIELREVISKYFNDEYAFNFDPKTEIIVTAGSKAAIHMSLMSIVNIGDEVIIPEPHWVSYTEQVKLCYGKPVTIPIQIPVFDWEKYVNKKTKAIILNNPNNPSGKIYTKDELLFLIDLVKKHKIWLLSDEVYSDFLPENETFISLGSLDKNLEYSIICNSISKNYGISGWRLGYVIANADLINLILKVNQHLITCPATILEYYIAKHFYDIIEITKPQIRKVVEKRKEVAEYMDTLGITYLPGAAAWYFLASIEPSLLNSEDFCMKLLKENHVCTVPGIGYGKSCDKHIRIAIGTEPWDRTTKGLNLIKNLIEETKTVNQIGVITTENN